MEILTLPWVERLLSNQMEFISRCLLMTRSLQGREDFSPGLVSVIQMELMYVGSAGMVVLNTGSEQKACVGIRKSSARIEHCSKVWSWVALEGSTKGQKWFQRCPNSRGLVPDPLSAAFQGLLAAKAADICGVGGRSALNKTSLGAGDCHRQSPLCHCLDCCDHVFAEG